MRIGSDTISPIFFLFLFHSNNDGKVVAPCKLQVELLMSGALVQRGLIIYDICQYVNGYNSVAMWRTSLFYLSCMPQVGSVPILLSLKVLRQWFKVICRRLAWRWLHKSNMWSLCVFIFKKHSKTWVGLSLPSGCSFYFFFLISCRHCVAITQNKHLWMIKRSVLVPKSKLKHTLPLGGYPVIWKDHVKVETTG